jgi:putative colanic acid biosynthesis acetyltransferase WcaF
MNLASPPRHLGGFTGIGYDKGRSVVAQALWFAVLNLLFVKWWLPGRFRPVLLRMFGADVGTGVFIRHRVRVLWPWKLAIGNDCWIGEDAWLLNLEPIQLGHDVCVSQGVFLCTGSHDRGSPTFEYDNGPIDIGDCAWIGAQATILRGVRVGAQAVIAACLRVSRDVPDGTLVLHNDLESRTPAPVGEEPGGR